MRKMAYIVKIDQVKQHPDADMLDVCFVDGWQIVTKMGEFKQHDLAIYATIDSWVPTELAPFLSKGKEPRVYNGIKGERLRTVRLRKQISQGLLLQLKGDGPSGVAYHITRPDGIHQFVVEGDDVTEVLGIQKWE